MKNVKGLGRVFAFTFRQQTHAPGYRRLTASLALLCFLIPAIVLGVMALRAGNEPAEPEYFPEELWEIPVCHADSILAHDETENPITDWSFLQSLHPQSWGEIGYTNDEVDNQTIVLKLYQTDGIYEAHVYLPNGTFLTEEDLFVYETFLWDVFPSILEVKAGLTPTQVEALYGSVDVIMPPVPESDPLEGMREVLGMILPYLGVMIMYFLVLFYGQGVANSVILEKTSKLMDFFLVSVEPAAMVLGKVLAMAAAGLLQLCIWLVTLAGGFGVGAWLCRVLVPGVEFGILTFFGSLRLFEGMFSLGGILLAVGILLGGFLIYCALAGVGGALAGKAEDLSSTNVFFSLTLVASFLICLLTGSGDSMISEAAWLNYVPFTAILVTPARVLLGQVSLGMGAVTLLIVLVTAAALCLAAGKIYRMMSLYKGDPPTPQKLLAMLKQDK